jgi:hypothetical protein
MGRKTDALRELHAFTAVPERLLGVDLAYHIAVFYVDLGDNDEAFRWLATAYRQRSGEICLLGADPRFDQLRSDPRFKELMEKLGFPA